MTGSSETPSPPPRERLAVFVQAEDKIVLIAKITITAGDEGSVGVCLEAESSENIAEIHPLLESIRGKERENPLATTREEGMNEIRRRVIDVLEKNGYGVEDISSGDVGINIEFDLHSGIRLATHRGLHEFNTEVDDSIAKNVIQAVASVMERVPNDVAEEIKSAVAGGNNSAILVALRAGDEKGAFSMRPTKKLFDALFSFDIESFGSADRKFVRERRLCVAHLLRRWELAGAEAEALLHDHANDYDSQQKADLEMELANAAMQKGHRETALLIWRKLLRSPETLAPGNRGWAWSNIALAASPEGSERRHAAKCSADAFLEAGDKEEASRSLMLLGQALLFEEPEKALETIGEIISLIEEKGLRNRALRAATYHTRGNRLLQMGRHAEAASDAAKAAEQLRGLIGAEDQLISSLHLAAIAYGFAGDSDQAVAFRQEADQLTEEAGSSHFRMAQRVQALLQEFDAGNAVELLREAEEERNQEVMVAVSVIQAMHDTTLSDFKRLSLLEDGLLKLDKAHAPEGLKQPGRLALAILLEKIGQPERAEIWYRLVLDADPFNVPARRGLVESLWHREKWGDAAIILKRQLDLRGPMPGLFYAYGRSLCEAGDYTGAVPALTQSINLADEDENLAKLARDLREQALNKGGTILPASPEKPASLAVTREEFDAALDAFARFISADKRMSFWAKKDQEEAWVERPEKRAQDLLHTFLKARFLERVNIFEELDSGAGRLDLYIQFYGGLNLIVELKMCGFGYSSNYAAAGETQILHYMENRDSKLGYLVVFDARLTMNGQKLLKGENSFTLFSKFIDMRPRIKVR